MMHRERRSRVVGAVVWNGRSDGSPGRVLPDGCIDLLWMDDRLVVAGPDTTALKVCRPAGVVTTGLRFAPGAAPAVVGAPAHELRDARIRLDDLWHAAEVRRAEATMRRSSSVGRGLEEVVAARAGRAALPDPIVAEVVRRTRAGERVGSIAQAVGLSARQLQRRANDVFGYGPKMLARILRLHQALAMAKRGVALAAVAARCGYTDQAHLAADVRALTGTTLGGLGLGERPGVAAQSGANRSIVLPSGSSTDA